jgi:hypothetical protein
MVSGAILNIYFYFNLKICSCHKKLAKGSISDSLEKLHLSMTSVLSEPSAQIYVIVSKQSALTLQMTLIIETNYKQIDRKTITNNLFLFCNLKVKYSIVFLEKLAKI